MTTLVDLEPGDHVCWAFDSDLVRLQATAEVVRAGVRDRHKIVHLTAALSPSAVLAGLGERGIDVCTLVDAGQLSVADVGDTYLARGRFDPERSVAGWCAIRDRARSDGFAGLRAIGDMSWAAHDVGCRANLARFEADVTSVWSDGYAIGICQYDTRLFGRGELEPIMSVHPETVATDRHGDPSARLRVRRLPGLVLSLEGEIDLTNQGAAEAAIARLRDDAVEAGAHATIDAGRLRFLTAAATGMIIDAAEAVPAGLTVTGCHRLLVRMLDVLGARGVPGLRVSRRATASPR